MTTVYLSAASFEERCLAMVRGLHRIAPQDELLLLEFEGYENVGPYLVNAAELRNLAITNGLTVTSIPCLISAPLRASEAIRKHLARIKPDHYVLDISALPRSFLFCLSKLPVDLGIPAETVYYRPESYGDDLSRGVRSVQAVPGFEGDPMPGADLVLMLLLGFEGYKAIQVWERLGPTEVVVLWGDPPFAPEYLETSRAKNAEFLELVGNPDGHQCHTYDVPTAARQLSKIFSDIRSRLPNSSIAICPLGTKLQSVAAFTLAYQHPEVSVIYVSSLKYFTGSYSRGWHPDPHIVNLSMLVDRVWDNT